MTDKNEPRIVRTRIAPSPTGYAHIGTIYQALFNYAFAKRYNGKFIVRIEDTDRARFVADAEDFIFNSLDWVGLIEDESPRKGGAYGPYRQSERLELYHKYAQELIDKDKAYYSYYPKEEATGKKDYSNTGKAKKAILESETPQKPLSIEEMVKNGDWVIRMRVPKNTNEIIVHDAVRGEIVFPIEQVTEQILIKSDGFPTYHFAVVIDDHLMEISHIVRAEEWIPSLPKHKLLYDYFGWKFPFICHTPTLRNPDKSKLSKRQGHTNVMWFKEEGYLPNALLNYLALLGWGTKEEDGHSKSELNDEEIFTIDQFIKLFHLNAIRLAAPIFDMTKLDYINGVYIRNLSDAEFKKIIYRYDGAEHKDSGFTDLDEDLVTNLIPIVKTRIKLLKEFRQEIYFFLYPHKRNKSNLDPTGVIKLMKEDLESLQNWNKEELKKIIIDKYIMNKKIKFKDLYLYLVDHDRGLPLADTFAVIGKDRTLALFS